MLDTNVVVAAMRSPTGASAALLMEARQDKLTLLANVGLALEYEATCTRAEHVLGSGLSVRDVSIFVDAVIAILRPVESHYIWRPMLRDPGDEIVLEAAANGHADAIVTFNIRDFGSAPRQFGIDLLNPAQAYMKMKA